MKVKTEIEVSGVYNVGRCDFCQVNEAKHTINGGLWWICTPCMEEQYSKPLNHHGVYGGEEE